MTVRHFQGISPRIAANAYVDDSAVVIGDVSIGEDASLWPMVVARGDINFIEIGARTNIQDGTILHVSHDSEFAPGGFPLRIGVPGEQSLLQVHIQRELGAAQPGSGG